jgi:hypothetical protein
MKSTQTPTPNPQTRFRGSRPSSLGILALAVLTLLYVVGCQHGGRCPSGTAAASQPGALVRYFFVVPQTLPDGGSSAPQCKALEAWLARTAGGYTRLGPCKGGWLHGGEIVEEDNIAYFVVGPDGLEPRIKRIIIEQFQQRRAFVTQW